MEHTLIGQADQPGLQLERCDNHWCVYQSHMTYICALRFRFKLYRHFCVLAETRPVLSHISDNCLCLLLCLWRNVRP